MKEEQYYYKMYKTDVERRQTLGHPGSINPIMINHVPQQSPLIFLIHICCLYTKQYKCRIRTISHFKVQ